MKIPPLLPIVSIAAVSGLMPLFAQMAPVGFGPLDPYQPGEIVNQPNIADYGKWTGNTGLGTVVATGGNPDGHLTVTHDGTEEDNNKFVRFMPALQASGFATFPQSIDFSFDVRLDSYGGDAKATLGGIDLLLDGGNPNTGSALKLSFKFGGDILILSDTFPGGHSRVPVFENGTSFVTFSGTTDFATHTTTLKINGTDANEGKPFNFGEMGGTGSDDYGHINVTVGKSAGAYSIDNISLHAAPEGSASSIP